jgi:glycosyltransferase involved in cell wall biosynthesis
MRILMISPTISGIGGIAQHVQGLKNFLENKGNEVEVISSENTFTVPIKGLKNPSFMISSFFKSKFKKNFDVVHAQNPVSAMAMKNVKGKKILSLQGDYSKQVLLLHGNTVGGISAKLEKNALEWADAITVPSKEMHEEYTKNGYKVFHVPNAIDISSFPKDKDKRYDKQLIYAGRLSEEKGILDLLKISERLPNDIHLLIVGSGPEESKVKEVAKTSSNIHYLGYQSKENTIRLIRGSDILVQPSLMEGGTSSTLLEAMACKTPIIATSVGGNKETVIHMKTGYIVDPHQPSQIYDAIQDLLSNPEKLHTLSEHAYELVSHYDWKSIGQKYLDVYNSV